MARRVVAAGAILWRPDPLAVAVVHRPRYDDWSLPKGKVEPDETVYQGAAREVAEETGYHAALGRHIGQIGYTVDGTAKTVDYFTARALEGSFAPNEEVDELRWLPPDEAVGLLTYQDDRAMVAAFAPDTAVVLLVRHAHAGKKATWVGPDEQRPLSAKGRHETAALTAFLPLFAPDRVHAAPKVRCVETVRPTAERIGVPVVTEVDLAEQSDEGAALGRLRAIAGLGGVSVVCSQGGVIPGLVAALAAESGVEVHGEVRSRKGSVWLLAFTGGGDPVLTGAHYVNRP